jgi:hypothetical protein
MTVKRYRTFHFDFDTRALILSEEIREDMEVRVKESWRASKQHTQQGLIEEFGSYGSDQKIENFTELGPKAISVVAYHNKFALQCREAFVIGAYYPALTGACALGERILNQLVLSLRDDFQHTAEHQKIRRRNSFEDWNLMIRTLAAWDVLRPEVVDDFGRLVNIRNNALHFHPDTDEYDRSQALRALQLINDIVDKQFGAFGSHPWLIEGTLGAAFIKQSEETTPFIRRIYLPNCFRVGPCHTMSHDQGRWFIHDNYDYGDGDMSDEEFRDLFNSAHREPGGYCQRIAR